METSISAFQSEVASKLNADGWFGARGIVWLAENTLDIEFQIKSELNRTGICAVVTTPELTYQGITADGNYAFTINRLVLQIVENPTINRGKPNASASTVATALEAAHTALYTLAGKQSDATFGNFTPVGIRQSTTNGGKLVLAEATLGCTVIL